MKFLNTCSGNLRKISMHRSLAWLPLLFLFVSIGFGQTNNSVELNEQNNETRPGRLLSEGSNEAPVGALQVLTYKLEEIRATRPVRIGINEKNLTGFRLTITTAAKLTGGNYTIWIDDNPYSASTLGQYKLVFVLDSEKLPDGASLAVSSVGVQNSEYIPVNISRLPERLSVPPPYGYSASETSKYTLKRVFNFVRSENRKISGVEIRIPNESGVTYGANRWVIQVGSKEYYASVEDDVISIWFSDADFARLNNGDLIRFKIGRGPLARGTTVGRLNKSLIEQ